MNQLGPRIRRIMVICLSLLLMAALWISCVRDVTLDAKEAPLVAVGCILSDEPTQRLYLSFTKGASESEAPPLTQAVVRLINKQSGEILEFKRKDGNEWTLEYAASPLYNYRLEIEVPGYDMLWAEQTMPKRVQMISRGYFFYANAIVGLHIPQSIFDTFVPNAEDFESLPLGSKAYYLRELPDPVWLFAMNYNPETGRHEIAEEICTDCVFVDSFNDTGTSYLPPQRSDIPNPYFEGSSLSMLMPSLEGFPIHRKYLRFPPRDLSKGRGWWFSLSGSLQGKYNCKDFYQQYYGDWGFADSRMPDEGYVKAVAVSADLDRYLLDAFQKILIKESTDLSTIFLRDNLFSNVTGGLGIFGACCSREYQWSGEYDYVDDGRDHIIPSGNAADINYIPDDKWPL